MRRAVRAAAGYGGTLAADRLRPLLPQAGWSRCAVLLLRWRRDRGRRAARAPCRPPAASAPVQAVRTPEPVRGGGAHRKESERAAAAAVATMTTILSVTALVPVDKDAWGQALTGVAGPSQEHPGLVKDCGPAGKDWGAAGVRTAGCAGSWPRGGILQSVKPCRKVIHNGGRENELYHPNLLNTKNIKDLSLDGRITGDIRNIFHNLYVCISMTMSYLFFFFSLRANKLCFEGSV